MADLKIYIQSIICMHEYIIRKAIHMLKRLLYHKKFKTIVGCVAMTMGMVGPGDLNVTRMQRHLYLSSKIAHLLF